ncbi:adaptor protein MecA [Streptococcus macacae]|uniref:Adapter protein MecA n=1 Tax=Streptococcus macacae NCTC 11558 TaxID=764298 RepID=G5JVB2_9STRE|nr:adaptor protein MecA [Streptococcus macacae]EHJ52421.1 negative regulator of genetic competence MecA [Streptococcus macacae NCTC 11558]SUN77739.1 adaptor protein [Streptococcus macacae NCTC 11558]
MKMKQISETTLKITISMEDLEERGMELKDFLVPQEKTEEFFYAVMDELELPENFKDSGMLSFRVTPRNDRIDVFVTKSEINKNLNLEDLSDFEDISKMSPEDFFKTLEETMREKGDAEALDRLAEAEKQDEESADKEQPEERENLDYIHFVLDFPNVQSAVNFAKTVDYEVEASEFFKSQDAYHMTILLNLENKPDYYADLIFAKMLEHADKGTKTRAYLLEHGVQIMVSDALKELQMIG